MSRRGPSTADRAAQNQETIKALLKLEGNKVCADCKRNKHPRWASWNLGVFVCIRCSGIHRGMGTHISRVKSVDLDSWTDEQLQSVLRWGNSRANKYWEAKLAQGHAPSEAKIENFIRTKYESKRWVMDGPLPDPSTLDAEGDDDVPLNIVQEKAKMERSASQRISSAPQPQHRQHQPSRNIDLFGDETLSPPVRPKTTDIPSSGPATKAAAPSAPMRQAKPADSLLGLDFFGSSQPANYGRPSSASSNPLEVSSTSRPDLKQSILSLYASTPKPQPAPSQPSHNRQPSFGDLSSPPAIQQDSFGGLADAFGGLNFSPSRSPSGAQKPSSPQATPLAFTGLGSSIPKSATAAPQVTSPPLVSGGNFFGAVPSKPPMKPKAPAASILASSNGLDFAFAQTPLTAIKPSASSVSNDPFASDDFTGFASASPAPPPVPPPTKVSSPSPPSVSNTSPFNLSAPSVPMSKSALTAPRPSLVVPQSSTAMFDPWASNNDNAWNAPEPAPARPAAPSIDIGKPPSHITPNDISGSWSSPISSDKQAGRAPKITADEDFGGWTSASASASATQTPAAGPSKANAAFGGSSDPFDNPWG